MGLALVKVSDAAWRIGSALVSVMAALNHGVRTLTKQIWLSGFLAFRVFGLEFRVDGGESQNVEPGGTIPRRNSAPGQTNARRTERSLPGSQVRACPLCPWLMIRAIGRGA